MNKLNLNKFISYITIISLLAVFGQAPVAKAAWWNFGKKDDTPEISDLKFNRFGAENADEFLIMGKDMLDHGRIIIRGKADAGPGKVGKVEISLDGGTTWKNATLGDRGNFNYEFAATPGQEFDFRIKALSTTGKSSDIEDHSFMLMISPESVKDAVKKMFTDVIQKYMQEDYSGFMNMVHSDFEGNRSELEDAVSDDFRFFDNIRIVPTITRIIAFDDSMEVYFTFTRQVFATKTGQLLNDSAASSTVFKMDSDGTYKLAELAAPLIFGVSRPTEVATSVTEEAVGQQVLSVDLDGNASKTAQADELSETSAGVTEESGSITTDWWYFDFSMGTENASSGDIQFEHNAIIGNGLKLLSTSFDYVTQVPAGPYTDVMLGVNAGDTIAVELADGNYALLEITNVTAMTSISFRYKYQPNGTRNF